MKRILPFLLPICLFIGCTTTPPTINDQDIITGSTIETNIITDSTGSLGSGGLLISSSTNP